MKLIDPDVVKAIRITWIIIGIIGCSAIIISGFLNPIHLKFVPICPSLSIKRECILCGMTRAFIKIGNLNFKAAYLLNKGSIFLYIGILLNAFFTIIYLIKLSYFNKLKTKLT